MNVGLEYLTLSGPQALSPAAKRSGFGWQRRSGSSLMGVLYILDEPSIGLHQRDNDRLIATLEHMRDLGNTLIVVEHDEDTMLGGGLYHRHGAGRRYARRRSRRAGSPKEIMADQNPSRAQYLSGRKFIPVPDKRRVGDGRFLKSKAPRRTT